MANFMNIFAGFFTFILAASFQYILYNPVMTFLSTIDSTVMYVFLGSVWLVVAIYSVAFLPVMMLVSDDRGG